MSHKQTAVIALLNLNIREWSETYGFMRWLRIHASHSKAKGIEVREGDETKRLKAGACPKGKHRVHPEIDVDVD
jgi:hypothetical protein